MKNKRVSSIKANILLSILNRQIKPKFFKKMMNIKALQNIEMRMKNQIRQ